MYHPKQGREQEQRTHRPEQGQFIRTALPVLTVVFWDAAAISMVMIAVYAFTQSMGAWLSWMTGISLLVYGLVFAGTFFVAFLYWLSLYFTR